MCIEFYYVTTGVYHYTKRCHLYIGLQDGNHLVTYFYEEEQARYPVSLSVKVSPTEYKKIVKKFSK